jgi:hypothetical protein
MLSSRAHAGPLRRAFDSQCSCMPQQTYFATLRRTQRQTVFSRRLFSQQSQQRPRFSSRLRDSLKNSKIQWYQIPAGVGIGFLGLMQFYKISTRKDDNESEEYVDGERRPKKRPRIRPDGPWLVRPILVSPCNWILYANNPVKASSGYVNFTSQSNLKIVG